MSPTDIMALKFLSRGPHTIGVIDDEDKLGAALGFDGLKKRGLVIAVITDNGPEYRLTDAGRRAAMKPCEDGEDRR